MTTHESTHEATHEATHTRSTRGRVPLALVVAFIAAPTVALCVTTMSVAASVDLNAMALNLSMSATNLIVHTHDDPPSTPSTAPIAPSTPVPPKSADKLAPRSLDELLGVPEAANNQSDDASVAGSADDAATREQKKRLQRALDEATLQDLVARAIEGMRTASTQLTDAKDPGIATQRVQEDVVRTLDRLLEEAKKQQKKGSKSSSQSKSGKPQGKSDDPAEQNGQQSSSKKSGEQKNSASGPGAGESSNESSRGDESVAGIELTESRIEWGQLPERVRELVLQGRRDRVSSIYERLTREYYRRLAEEASK